MGLKKQMAHAYSEEQLIEQNCFAIFENLTLK